MRRRPMIRVISLLSAAAVCLGASACVSFRRAERAERELRYRGEQAFTELCDAVGGLDTALKKSRYALAPGVTAALCAEVCSRAQSAAGALSALPFPMQELEQTAAFLAKTGDYTAWLLRRSGGGEALSDEERENLRSLGDSAALLHENLEQLRADMADGLISPDAAEALEAGLPSLSDGFLDMEQEFPEIPSLVYDGPFSSGAADKAPLMTRGTRTISADEAMLVASGFLNARSNQAALEGESDGKIPVWRVRIGEYTVCVSKQGGYVVQAISSRTPLRSVLTDGDALAAAEKILADHSFRNMRESYHIRTGHVLTVTFCAAERGAVCYPDMIKAAVSMDTGELLFFDAEAYLTSHTRRDLPAPEMTEADAAARVPEGLTLLAQGLAVIPTEGGGEVFCRELKCADEEGQHYLLYFNALTGAQEKILVLLEDETGTLAL